eukprot:595421-Pyramimonas_sp.AAC.1
MDSLAGALHRAGRGVGLGIRARPGQGASGLGRAPPLPRPRPFSPVPRATILCRPRGGCQPGS